MANHPSRNKPSRDALEMIAHFARHGIALEREQQEAVAIMCRAARVVCRVATQRCNGPTRYNGESIFLPAEAWARWEAELDRQAKRAADRILKAAPAIGQVEQVTFNGDPRGATVKLIMVPEWRRLHDSFGSDAYCVPGS